MPDLPGIVVYTTDGFARTNDSWMLSRFLHGHSAEKDWEKKGHAMAISVLKPKNTGPKHGGPSMPFTGLTSIIGDTGYTSHRPCVYVFTAGCHSATHEHNRGDPSSRPLCALHHRRRDFGEAGTPASGAGARPPTTRAKRDHKYVNDAWIPIPHDIGNMGFGLCAAWFSEDMSEFAYSSDGSSDDCANWIRLGIEGGLYKLWTGHST